MVLVSPPPSSPPSPSPPDSSGDDGSLSGGALAGIVIAVVVAFALIVRAALPISPHISPYLPSWWAPPSSPRPLSPNPCPPTLMSQAGAALYFGRTKAANAAEAEKTETEGVRVNSI